MKVMLLTKEVRERLPKLYANEKVALDEQVLQVKFFTPDSDWTWYAGEFDGSETFFGVVVTPICPDGEWGYFNLKELESAKGPMGLSIERDRNWEPRQWKKIKESLAS